MYKGIKRLAAGVLAALLLAAAPHTFALPTAESFGVDDANGYRKANVMVPVIITTVQNGPVISMVFDITYDTGVINIVDVQKGTLTSSWDDPSFQNYDWGTRISIVYDGDTTHALQNGSTGSVTVLNLKVTGRSGETSMMNLSTIQLADTSYTIGTAPAKNGTFSCVKRIPHTVKGTQ
ncbi:MAG: hypothetical protein EFT35_00105 [Methanophagales archaeon ANME-1-THS]|nr:MAG: hypothetical protein EFT35_00105 [Methanophagales archaeon ANME-1-THS]